MLDKDDQQEKKAPIYQNSLLKSRIVHFGFGAFHRSHQALYTSELHNLVGGDWGICEVDLFGQKNIEQLRQQDHRYHVLEKGAESNTLKLSSSINESLHANLDGPAAIIAKLTEQQVAIVSMTITEKGYCADFVSGKLDVSNSLIEKDLANPHQPCSVIGYIVEGLRIRKDLGIQPFTVMSCDNINSNGHVAKAVILDYANLIDPALGLWIDQHVTFPCTMVDRITPAVTAEDEKDIATILGYSDPCAVVCEPFRQWVIEDDFVNGKPEWDKVGAQFVTDVAPFEEMKLRMLNGSHSFMAYMGYLAGYDYISEVITDQNFRSAVYELMMNEQAESLNTPPDIDLNEYANRLIERFSNPSLKHRTWQIAMDGSQKVPPRFCESISILKAKHKSTKWLSLGIAAWMKYVGRCDDLGRTIDVVDPLVKQFDIIYKKYPESRDIGLNLLAITSIFGVELIKDEQFVTSVLKKYDLLNANGAKKTIKLLLSD
ncbi:fructuronate reductase [Vibrio sp. TH_r3]|uniref:mannitol dehydrogenase family protein n=1 Tax=Vibrio sp. TH_r3 TaxID=3082084 RepID=UPI002955C6A6|nr:fructuronate reductase [Vibrio sp. TH_r3]MDV7105633.1 fructuronate reductase [Vibrio sp. TH_r3]